jgi:hypothetical protein
MKFRMPRRWRKSKKSTGHISTRPNIVANNPRTTRTAEEDHVRQAIENVRASQAPPGEEYALTILENNEELVGWMNACGYRMSSAQSSMRRNAITDGLVDWRSSKVAPLEADGAVDCEGQALSSGTSASTMGTNASETKKFGNSGIEILGCGRRHIQGPRVQVKFRSIDWNPPPNSRLECANGIGPGGEIADWGL